MATLFTVSKKGGNNGNLWNGATPEGFFSTLRKEGVKKIWDVRRSPNSMYGSFFDTKILTWCCKQVDIEFEHRLDLAPEKELFAQCDEEGWNLYQYAQAYFTDQIVAVLNSIKLEDVENTAILCAEQGLYNCHRLLIALYLQERFPKINVKHLGLAYDRYKNEKDAPERSALQNTINYIKTFCRKVD